MAATRTRKRKVNIRFYRLIVNGSKTVTLDFQSLRDQSQKTVALVKRSHENGDEDFYLAECEPNALTNAKLRILFAKRLRSGSPHYLEKDNIQVADVQDWVAPTYAVFFPSGNVVGVITGVEGPRMPAIAILLEQRFFGANQLKVDFEPIARENIEAELKRLSIVSRVTMQFSPSDQPTLFSLPPDVATFMKSLVGMREAAKVTLQISASKKGSGLREMQKALEGLIRSPALKKVTQFSVDGQDQHSRRMRHVDLLEDDIIVSKTVEIEEGAKNLLSDAAYGAIEESYGEIGPSNFPSVKLTVEE